MLIHYVNLVAEFPADTDDDALLDLFLPEATFSLDDNGERPITMVRWIPDDETPQSYRDRVYEMVRAAGLPDPIRTWFEDAAYDPDEIEEFLRLADGDDEDDEEPDGTDDWGHSAEESTNLGDGSLFGLTDRGSRRWRATVGVGSSGGVGAVTRQLAEVLAGLADGEGQHNVVVTLERSGRYCQVVVDPLDGAWVEAQADRFVADPTQRMDPGQAAALGDLGFAAPDGRVPNHHCVFEPPVAWADVAALMVAAQIRAFGLGDDDHLTVKVFPHVRTDDEPERGTP